nr:hypothetical protein B0A51_00065 [Rachicladosporium sp. CCFEE 5018]
MNDLSGSTTLEWSALIYQDILQHDPASDADGLQACVSQHCERILRTSAKSGDVAYALLNAVNAHGITPRFACWSEVEDLARVPVHPQIRATKNRYLAGVTAAWSSDKVAYYEWQNQSENFLMALARVAKRYPWPHAVERLNNVMLIRQDAFIHGGPSRSKIGDGKGAHNTRDGTLCPLLAADLGGVINDRGPPFDRETYARNVDRWIRQDYTSIPGLRNAEQMRILGITFDRYGMLVPSEASMRDPLTPPLTQRRSRSSTPRSRSRRSLSGKSTPLRRQEGRPGLGRALRCGRDSSTDAVPDQQSSRESSLFVAGTDPFVRSRPNDERYGIHTPEERDRTEERSIGPTRGSSTSVSDAPDSPEYGTDATGLHEQALHDHSASNSVSQNSPGHLHANLSDTERGSPPVLEESSFFNDAFFGSSPEVDDSFAQTASPSQPASDSDSDYAVSPLPQNRARLQNTLPRRISAMPELDSGSPENPGPHFDPSQPQLHAIAEQDENSQREVPQPVDVVSGAASDVAQDPVFCVECGDRGMGFTLPKSDSLQTTDELHRAVHEAQELARLRLRKNTKDAISAWVRHIIFATPGLDYFLWSIDEMNEQYKPQGTEILTKPVVLKAAFLDAGLLSFEVFALRQRRRRPDLVCPLLDRLEQARGHESTAGYLSLSDVIVSFPNVSAADEPPLTRMFRHSRLKDISHLRQRPQWSPDDPFEEYNRLSNVGSFTGTEADVYGGSWMRNLLGRQLYFVVPWHPDVWGKYIDHPQGWSPDGNSRAILLEPDDVLILPPGLRVIHAALALEPSLVQGGLLWDEHNMGPILESIKSFTSSQQSIQRDVAHSVIWHLRRLEATMGNVDTSDQILQSRVELCEQLREVVSLLKSKADHQVQEDSDIQGVA